MLPTLVTVGSLQQLVNQIYILVLSGANAPCSYLLNCLNMILKGKRINLNTAKGVCQHTMTVNVHKKCAVVVSIIKGQLKIKPSACIIQIVFIMLSPIYHMLLV